MKTLVLLTIFCISFVSGLHAQNTNPGREFTGVDFEANLIAAGREFTGVDFEATLVSAGREFTGVDFIATSTQKPEDKADLSIEDLILPREIYSGISASITVRIKNNSKLNIPGCIVFLSTDTGYHQEEKISLSPNGTVTKQFAWIPKSEGPDALTVAISYPQDTNPQNNKKTERVRVMKQEDLDLAVVDIRTPDQINLGEPVKVEVLLANETNIECRGCYVLFETQDGFRDKTEVRIRPNSKERALFTWTPKEPGRQRISAALECRQDSNPNNNQIKQTVEVIKKKVETSPEKGIMLEEKRRDRSTQGLNKEER